MNIENSFFFFILTFFFYGTALAQTEYDPSVLILSPDKIEIQRSLKKEFQSLEDEIINRFKSDLEYLQSSKEELPEQESFQLMFESRILLAENMDFGNNFSFMIGSFLQYKFSELYPDYLILHSIQESKINQNELNHIASKSKVRYVISIPKIEIERKNQKTSNIRIILYDLIQDRIIIDKAFSGNEQNPGFTFACEDGSITCTTNNAASVMLEEILGIINQQSPFLTKQRIINFKRDSIIANSFSDKKSAFLSKSIVQKQNPELIIGDFFQEIFNDDTTKFIAVTVERNRAKNFQDFSKYYPTNINILTEGREEELIIDVFPNTYAQIIYGINFEEKWYIETAEATIFPARTIESGGLWFLSNFLKENSFFEDETVIATSSFWETGLFEKVIDISQTEEYNRYPEMYETELRDNAQYIGKYKLVAKLQRKAIRAKLEKFGEKISSSKIEPFLEELKKSSINEFTLLNSKELLLIYPSDTSHVLIPLSINKTESGDSYLYYYLYDSSTESFYRWTYFEPIRLNSSVYGSDVRAQLNTIVDWHFGFDFLDDQNFWQDYVFKKENRSYKFLEHIK